MSPSLWLCIAAALCAAELLTGTFFLLALAAAAAAGALAALASDSFLIQLAAAAASGIAGCTLAALWLSRRGKSGGPEASIDEGRRVTVGRWENGRAVVRYRGTRWDAEPAPGCDPVPGEWTIARTEGSVLILERRTD